MYLNRCYGGLTSLMPPVMDWAMPNGPENTKALIRALEYAVTGENGASDRIPASVEDLCAYLRYRLAVEHPSDMHLGSEYGFTDDFFLAAIAESVHFFS